jgi:hypothetical protein
MSLLAAQTLAFRRRMTPAEIIARLDAVDACAVKSVARDFIEDKVRFCRCRCRCRCCRRCVHGGSLVARAVVTAGRCDLSSGQRARDARLQLDSPPYLLVPGVKLRMHVDLALQRVASLALSCDNGGCVAVTV